MSPQQTTLLFFSLATLLGCARLFGEIAKRYRQPAVIGEILAGIFLGQTVFGSMFPGISELIFPSSGLLHHILQAFGTVSIAMFLLVAGMEVDISVVWRQGKSALSIGILSLVIPFATGLLAVLLFPEFFAGGVGEDKSVTLALFFATAMAISALPVIAKTLMDLNLYRTDVGMLIIASAILNDFVGWNIFAMILGRPESVAFTVFITLGFATVMLTLGRKILDLILPWLQAHASWPSGVLGFILTGAFLSAAVTEWIGIHALFGSFIFGIAVGDSKHLREKTRTTIDQFVSSVFAPIFFASIGLGINFLQHFDWALVLAVLLLGSISKLFGASLGARISGLPWRQSAAIGCGLNARGAMEIILGLLALRHGVISEPLFVALVILALVTSISSGTLIQSILGHARMRPFTDYFSTDTFVVTLQATDSREAILELTAVAAAKGKIDADSASRAVLEREELMPTSLRHGLAVPHARLPNLKNPVIAAGISKRGVDFNAEDGSISHLIFLILTPEHEDTKQLEILADITRIFLNPHTVEKAFHASNYTEFLAMIKIESNTVHSRHSVN